MPKPKKNDASKTQEFDKDYIFNLIMPSAGAAPPPDLAPQTHVNYAQMMENMNLPNSGSDTVADSLAELRAKLFVNDGLQINESKNLILVNIMERLVLEKLDDAFSKFRCCRCDKCKKDVVAIALNHLPPQYILSDPDDIDSLAEKYRSQDIYAALIKAILQVKTHPRH